MILSPCSNKKYSHITTKFSYRAVWYNETRYWRVRWRKTDELSTFYFIRKLAHNFLWNVNALVCYIRQTKSYANRKLHFGSKKIAICEAFRIVYLMRRNVLNIMFLSVLFNKNILLYCIPKENFLRVPFSSDINAINSSRVNFI